MWFCAGPDCPKQSGTPPAHQRSLVCFYNIGISSFTHFMFIHYSSSIFNAVTLSAKGNMADDAMALMGIMEAS